MPIYDVVCDQGHAHLDLYRAITDTILCVTCGAPTKKLWTVAPTVVENGWPGGRLFENLGPVPMRFESRSDFTRYLTTHHLEPFVRHTPTKGSDKSPHTTHWSSIGPETLAGATAMLERVNRPTTRTNPATYITQWSATTTESTEPVQTCAPLQERTHDR
jgi:hypothetical protein